MHFLQHSYPLVKRLQSNSYSPQMIVQSVAAVALTQDIIVYFRDLSNDGEFPRFLLWDKSRRHALGVPFSGKQTEAFELLHESKVVQSISPHDRMQPMRLLKF